MNDTTTDHPRQPLPLRRRVIRWFAAALALAIACSVAYFYWLRYWPQPVVPTTLENLGVLRVLRGTNWRNLPFTLSAEEEATVAECERVGRTVRSTHNGEAQFDRDDARRRLEVVLEEHSEVFHSESLLALWHRRHGDHEAAGRYLRRAADHAPVTLVQRFAYADGTPLAGATVREVQVECNRVVKGALDPSLKLTFFDLTTDAEGCIRMPVYDTVYRLFSIAHPEGHSLDLPTLGWFAARGKVGLLPAATVRRME